MLVMSYAADCLLANVDCHMLRILRSVKLLEICLQRFLDFHCYQVQARVRLECQVNTCLLICSGFLPHLRGPWAESFASKYIVGTSHCGGCAGGHSKSHLG